MQNSFWLLGFCKVFIACAVIYAECKKWNKEAHNLVDKVNFIDTLK